MVKISRSWRGRGLRQRVGTMEEGHYPRRLRRAETAAVAIARALATSDSLAMNTSASITETGGEVLLHPSAGAGKNAPW